MHNLKKQSLCSNLKVANQYWACNESQYPILRLPILHFTTRSGYLMELLKILVIFFNGLWILWLTSTLPMVSSRLLLRLTLWLQRKSPTLAKGFYFFCLKISSLTFPFFLIKVNFKWQRILFAVSFFTCCYSLHTFSRLIKLGFINAKWQSVAINIEH